ncbi:MAG: flippase-like domain-containing protein [Caldilineaceae bacterium]|nr:flippase-like domain-containing protein [Caldilineaceae bacterium]
MSRTQWGRWRDGILLGLGLLLFWLFARQIEWHNSLALLRRLGPSPFVVYLTVNGVIALLFTGRWWLLLAGMGYRLPFLKVAAYRLIGATVSLLTPGPQFGGEPVQVYYLVRHSGLPPGQAVASVALDRLLEISVNFIFLIAGLVYALEQDFLIAGFDQQVLILALLPLALPPLLFAFWWKQPNAASIGVWFLGRLPEKWQGPGLARTLDVLAANEARLHRMLHAKPRLLAIGVLFSLINWAILLADFWLASRLIGMELDTAQFIGFVVAARVAILLPIPAGLGVLEASQIFAASQMGLDPGLGLALVLLFRARDAALALLGLALAWQKRRQPIAIHLHRG